MSNSNKILTSRLGIIEKTRKEITSSKLVENVIGNIPKMPIYTADLLSKLLDESTSVQEVTEMIRKDPPLAGAILRNVNSAYYGLQRKIGSIHHAIAYLGFENIYRIVLNDFVNSIFPNKEEFYLIQNHSVLISILSQEISLTSKKIKSHSPITIGVLHDIGKIVVLLLKDQYTDMVEFFDLLDDSVIGAKLLARWGLPESVSQVIRHHQLPEFCPPHELTVEYADDIVILYLAHVYSEMLTQQSLTSTTFLNEYLALLNVPHKEPRQFYQEAIIPGLHRNRQRLPEPIRHLLAQHD